MYCFDCTVSNTIYIYTSKSYPCKALAVLGLSAKCRQCRQNLYFAKKKNTVKPLILQCFLNGDGGIRTHDLYTASVALSQLSYAPESGFQLRPYLSYRKTCTVSTFFLNNRYFFTSAFFQHLFRGFFPGPFSKSLFQVFFPGLFFTDSFLSNRYSRSRSSRDQYHCSLLK